MRCALILSSNRYRHYASLHYCHQDALLLGDTLTQWCDYDTGSRIVHLELDRQSETCTPRDLLAALRRLDAEDRATWRPGDSPAQHTYLVYFAGHGIFDEATRASYLLLPDSDPADLAGTALSLRDLRDVLGGFRRPIVQLLDACHSGVALRGAAGELPPPSSHGFVADLRRHAERPGEAMRGPSPGWEMLAACDEDESSHEDAQLQHGVFTYALADAIRRAPAAAELPLATIKDEVCARVSGWAERLGYTQNPVFAARTYGRHVFARRNQVDPAPPAELDVLMRPANTGEHHALTLSAGRPGEVDIAGLVVPRSRCRLALSVALERDTAVYRLHAAPHVTLGGRAVLGPEFKIGRNHSLRVGPYDWHEFRIRLHLTSHQAIVDLIALDGREAVVSVAVP